MQKGIHGFKPGAANKMLFIIIIITNN